MWYIAKKNDAASRTRAPALVHSTVQTENALAPGRNTIRSSTRISIFIIFLLTGIMFVRNPGCMYGQTYLEG
jgi:hypothetical protein